MKISDSSFWRTSFGYLLGLLSFMLLVSTGLNAQIYNQNPHGMGRVAQPTPQDNRPEEPKTAEEIMDEAMPDITAALDLNEFEQAVMRSVLMKYLKKRMELQILELPPDQAKEAYERIEKEEDEELKFSLPEDKYTAYITLKEQGPNWKRKASREKKKKEKKNKNKKEESGDGTEKDY